jgi:hypothetical protein
MRMSVSRGNELLQELYNRLTGLWFKKGRYKTERITAQEVKELINEIKKEYDDEVRQSESDNE